MRENYGKNSTPWSWKKEARMKVEKSGVREGNGSIEPEQNKNAKRNLDFQLAEERTFTCPILATENAIVELQRVGSTIFD